MKLLIRMVRIMSLSTLALLLILIAVIQIQQRLLRHRAERLLETFQSIRLHQTSWAEAQMLMTRWGAWGHYEGQCTASRCAYTITLSDAVSTISRHINSDIGWRRMTYMARAYHVLGGKFTTFRVSFLVQDATIWRSGVWLNLEILPYFSKADSYVLLLSARASDSLHAKRHGPWILGADDQLAAHPNYKEGGPSGCEGCVSRQVTFTPYISAGELRQLTSYDLSCLTRFRPCLNPQDVLPIASEWKSAQSQPKPAPPPIRCEIPIFARARDAEDVLVVDVLSSRIVKRQDQDDPSGKVQITTVRVVQQLKGTPPNVKLLDAVPVASRTMYVDSYFERPPQNLLIGKRYIIFPDETPQESQIGLDFCSVVDDAPALREQVQKGLDENDVLQQPEEFGSMFW